MRRGASVQWPRIRSRRTTRVSSWVSIVAREVEFKRGAKPQTYHAVEQADYIAIVALTRSGKIFAPCGAFLVHSATAATSVRLNAPYDLQRGDGWVVTKQLPGDRETGPVVLKQLNA